MNRYRVRGIVAGAVALTVLAAGLAAAQRERPPEAQGVFAERGYAAVAPENTLAALRAAENAGVPRAWIDVRSTADGGLVLLADATLDRTTDCTGDVGEQALATVTACDAGGWFDPAFTGEHVPTLADALAVPALRLGLELHGDTVAPLVAAVRAAGAEDRVLVASTREDVLRALAATAPALERWLRAPTLNTLVRQLALDVGATGVATGARGLEASDVERAHDDGLAVLALGAADERTVLAAHEAGVDDIVTARVEPAVWALGYAHRTYGGPDFGRPNVADQGFPLRLAVGDFNGDDRDDLVIGAPFDSSAAPGGGWFGVAHGADRFPGHVFSDPGTERDANWGDVFAVGDYDDDGNDDLVIGAPARSFTGPQSGALYLWSGSAAGIGGQARPFGPSLGAGAALGDGLATGDYDGDGVADLAVAAPGVAVGNQSAAGQVVIMPGRPGAGPVTGGALAVDRSLEEVPGDPAARERFGSVLTAGDFNDDGFTDLAIGSPGRGLPGMPNAGSVTVVYCGADPETGALIIARAEEFARDHPDVPGEPGRGASFGGALTASDFDGDGYDDLVIGSPGATVDGRTGAGDVTTVYGAALGLDTSRATTMNQGTALVPGEVEARSGFGAVLGTGDLNADGRPDLLVGAPTGRSGALPEVGSATVIYADASGLQPRVALRFAPGFAGTGVPSTNRQRYGSAMVVADLNGDRAPDLAVSAPGLTVDGIVGAGGLVTVWGYDAARPGVATATPLPPTVTPTPTATLTPRPTATAPPAQLIYVPYATRLRSLDRFPTPVLPE